MCTNPFAAGDQSSECHYPCNSLEPVQNPIFYKQFTKTIDTHIHCYQENILNPLQVMRSIYFRVFTHICMLWKEGRMNSGFYFDYLSVG